MALNFTEKQHWKTRIEAKLNQRIARLRADHADLIDALNDQAQDDIVAARGLADDFKELNRIDDGLLALEEEKAELLQSMQTKVTGEPESGDDRWSFSHIHSELAELRRERVESLLREQPCGRQLEILRNEKERLADAVMLATSIHQIIDLWDRVTTLASAQDLEPAQDDLFSGSKADSDEDDKHDC